MQRHLTSTNPELEAAAARTPYGMAHWAGSGPIGKTCGQCVYLVDVNRSTPRRCAKYQQMMRRWGGVIARSTAACKYFEAKPGDGENSGDENWGGGENFEQEKDRVAHGGAAQVVLRNACNNPPNEEVTLMAKNQSDNGGSPPIPKPSAFDPEKCRSRRGAAIASVATLQQALPTMRIADAKDFVRCHPDDDFRTWELCFVSVPIKGDRHDSLHLINEELALMYLSTAQVKRFALCLASKPHDVFFLCQVPTQNTDNGYNRSALRAIEESRRKWVQAISRRDEGADEYQVRYARDADAFPEPKWPKQSIFDLIGVTFNGRTIDNESDPALLRLLGAKPPL